MEKLIIKRKRPQKGHKRFGVQAMVDQETYDKILEVCDKAHKTRSEVLYDLILVALPHIEVE